MKKVSGFTLIEVLIYIAIFAVSALLLTNILTTTTNIQSRQNYSSDVVQQINFVASTIDRLVRQSSLIENSAGVSSSTLVLRMASSTLDPTKIFTDASNTAIYLQQGNQPAIALTTNSVKVLNFSVKKLENLGGRAIVNADISLASNTNNPQMQYAKDVQISITRVSAANFDYSLVPNSAYDIGTPSAPWNNAYFAGKVGIGNTTLNDKLVVTGGNVYVTDSGSGFILNSGSGCFKFTVNASGTLVSTAVSCP
ncbi:MAG: PulJ/GspJ family protein [Minisyncoccia bacterium]